MSDDNSPSEDVTLFEKLLIPDIFSEILRFVGKKDRLNLRLCNHAIEEAVAQSDIHVPHRDFFDSTMHISGACDALTISLRGILTMRSGYDSHSVNAMIRARKRLFKRAYVDLVKINNVDYNIVKIDQIKKLLKGCIFNKLVMMIRRKEFSASLNDFIREQQRSSVRLLLKGCMLDDETLLALTRTGGISALAIRCLKYSDEIIRKLSASTLLQLIRRGHEKLSVPVDFTSGKSILDVIKAIAQNDEKQKVELFVKSAIVDEFLMMIGVRRTTETIEIERRSNFSLEVSNAASNQFFDDADQYRGDYKLFYFERDHCKVQICVADRDMDEPHLSISRINVE